MSNLDAVYSDGDESYTVRQAINTAGESAELAEKSIANRKLTYTLLSSERVSAVLTATADFSSLGSVGNVISKITQEYIANMEYMSKNPPESAEEAMLDQAILIGDMLDDSLMFLAGLLKDNKDFINSVGCQLLSMMGIESVDTGIVPQMFELASNYLDTLGFVLDFAKKITSTLLSIKSFFADIVSAILAAIQSAILGIIKLIVDTLMLSVELRLKALMGFDLTKFLINSITQNSSAAVKNPNYVKFVVDSYMDGVLNPNIQLNMDIYMKEYLSTGKLKLRVVASRPKNIVEMLDLPGMIKSTVTGALYTLMNTLMGFIEQFFSIISSMIGDEPPALLVKLDKLFGIFGNIYHAMSDITGSASKFLEAMKNCNVIPKDMRFETLFELVYENPDGNIFKQEPTYPYIEESGGNYNYYLDSFNQNNTDNFNNYMEELKKKDSYKNVNANVNDLSNSFDKLFFNK
jgi:hypothetical protein